MQRCVVSASVLGLVMLGAGCGSPTAPPDAALAAHFDSLTTLARPSDDSRYFALIVITNGLAHGARPVHVTITVAGVPKAFEAVGTELANPDSAYPRLALFAAWSDSDASTMVYGETYNDSGAHFENAKIIFIRGDSSEFSLLPYVGTHEDNFFHPRCTNVPIVNVADGEKPTCMLGASSWSFDVVMGDGGALLPGGAAISMAETLVPTDLLWPPAPVGSVDRALRLLP
jgi:hypothetical protein